MAVCERYRMPRSAFLSWDEDDQDAALAYADLLRDTCSGCGTRAEEWAADPTAYVASMVRCPGCEAIEIARRSIAEDAHAEGVAVFLEPTALVIAREEARG